MVQWNCLKWPGLFSIFIRQLGVELVQFVLEYALNLFRDVLGQLLDVGRSVLDILQCPDIDHDLRIPSSCAEFIIDWNIEFRLLVLVDVLACLLGRRVYLPLFRGILLVQSFP